MKRDSFIAVLARSQVSAFCGGVVDYSIMLILTEFFGVHYALSIVIGGAFGAMVNYTANRRWTFEGTTEPKKTQIPKFITVVIGTIFLKSTGTYLFTEFLHIDYKISRLIVDLFVAFGFNFTLQKYWVFRG